MIPKPMGCRKLKNGQASHLVIFFWSFHFEAQQNHPSFHTVSNPSIFSLKDSDPPFADVLEDSLNSLPLLKARALKGGLSKAKGGVKEA